MSRCLLLCAVSRNGGTSWELPTVIEDDINYEWSYPGVAFHSDDALIHYTRSPVLGGGRELMLARVPVKSLHDDAI